MYFSRLGKKLSEDEQVKEIVNRIKAEGGDSQGVVNHALHLSSDSFFVGKGYSKSDMIGFAWDEIDAVATDITIL